MATYNPGIAVERKVEQGIARIRVDDFGVTELLIQAISQLKLISLKLDCFQPDDEPIDENELDSLES